MVITEKDAVRFWSKVDRSRGSDACWPYGVSQGQVSKILSGRRWKHLARKPG